MPTTTDARHFWEDRSGQKWCDSYRGSFGKPVRDAVLAAVTSLSPTRRVLEIGCHCGPLLRRLREAGFDAHGIDANSEAIGLAKADGFSAAVGTVPEALASLEPFDVVVSSYCLAYIAPADLIPTLIACLQISRLGMVLAEPSAGPGIDTGVHIDRNYVEWRHEYLDALEHAVARMRRPPYLRMTRTRLDPDVYGVNALMVVRITWPK